MTEADNHPLNDDDWRHLDTAWSYLRQRTRDDAKAEPVTLATLHAQLMRWAEQTGNATVPLGAFKRLVKRAGMDVRNVSKPGGRTQAVFGIRLVEVSQ